VDPEFVEVAQGTRVLILILFQAGKFDVLYSGVSVWRECPMEPTNFHDLQFTLYLIIVAILFELLFEVIVFGGLQRFVSKAMLRKLIDIHSPGHEPREHTHRLSSLVSAPAYLLMSSVFPKL